MKKILLLLTALAGLSTLSHAQEFGFQKGDVLLEGNASFYTTKNKQYYGWNSTQLSLNPKVGYFVDDNWVLGLDLGFQSNRTKSPALYPDQEIDKSQTYRFGVFGRYYFLKLGERFNAFAEASTSYGLVRNDGWSFAYEKADNYAANAGFGANYFITPKIAVGYSFGSLVSFTSQKPDLPNAERIDRFRLNVNSFDNFFKSGVFSLSFKF